MPNPVKLKYYRRASGGNMPDDSGYIYEAVPEAAGNVVAGEELTPEQWMKEAKAAKVLDTSGKPTGQTWYQKTLQQFPDLEAGLSSYITNPQTGNIQLKSSFDEAQRLAADPNMINVGTATAPLYIPKGSPAAAQQAGVSQEQFLASPEGKTYLEANPQVQPVSAEQPVQAAGLQTAATQGTTPYYGTLQDLANKGLQVSGNQVYSNGKVVGTYGGVNPSATPPTGELLTQPETTGLKAGESDKDSGLALQKRVEETDKNLTANKDFVNAAFKAYHGRDANANELTKFAGLTVGEVIKQIKGGSPDKGFNADLLASSQTGGQAGLQAGQAGQPFAVPTGYEKISGAQFPTGEAQKAAYSDIKADPTGTFLYGKKIAKDKVAEAAGMQAGGAAGAAGEAGGTNLLTSSSVAQSRQEILDKIDELAGTIKTAKEEAGKTYGLEAKSQGITDAETKLAEKTAYWDKRLADNRSATVDMRVIEGNEAELLRMKNLDLLPLAQMVDIKQGNYDRAEKMAKEYADDLYDAKKLELDKLKTKLGFLSEDEERKYDEAKDKLEERKSMAKNGYVYISDPSQLKELSPDQIIKIPNASGVDDIYKIPEDMSELEIYEAKKKIDAKYKTGEGGGTTVNEKQATQEMITQLSTVAGGDGYVSPDDYLTARNAWVAEGLNPTTFDTKMAGFKNPNNPYYTTTKQKEQPKTNIQLLEENKTKGITREQVKTAGFSDEEINKVYGEEEPWWKFW